MVITFFHSLLWAALFMLTFFTVLAALLYYLLMNWGITLYQELES